MSIYQENILDHYENPRNFGRLKDYDTKAHDSNPLCGDSFEVELKFEKGKVKDAMFSGYGCAISTASASMLTERIKGKSIEEIKKIQSRDILEMLGIELSHVRLKCAMLPLKVVKIATYSFLHRDKD